MIESIKDFEIKFNNRKNLRGIKVFNKLLKNFSFAFITKNNFQNYYQKNNQSKIIIADEFNQYLLICLDQTIFMIAETDIILLNNFFDINKNSTIYTLSETANKILSKYRSTEKEEPNFSFILKNTIEVYENEEYYTMCKQFYANFNNNDVINYDDLWSRVQVCSYAYFIKKINIKYDIDRFEKYKRNFHSEKIDTELRTCDYVYLKQIGSGSESIVRLIYHIEREELFAIKQYSRFNNEKDKLIIREDENSLTISHPLLPHYYGKTKHENDECLVTEYIQGKTLLEIPKMHLNINEKLNLIFEIMNIIEYIHNKDLVYRDLKPSNFIIDKDKNIVLIDFDRMLNKKKLYEGEATHSFIHDYFAPEIITDSYASITKKADIYSLGLIIYFIFFEKHPIIQEGLPANHIFNEFPDEFKNLRIICQQCTQKNQANRPSILQLIIFFYIKFYLNNFEKLKKYYECITLQNVPKDKFDIYVYNIFDISFINEKIPNNIQKTIYYSLFMMENDPITLSHLGIIYYTKNPIDFPRAFHFFTLSAKQNNPLSQYYIGKIYYEGKYVTKDINKAIEFFKLSAKQKDLYSQYYLGVIYFELQDIKRAIHYLTISANENFLQSQVSLGFIYNFGILTPKDIHKAIIYYSLAANQNSDYGHFYLGLIYYDPRYNCINIKKAIYHLNQAAKRGFWIAHYYLGMIYNEDIYITRDIRKAIEYFTLAAKNKFKLASLYLGNIYYENHDYENAKIYLLQASKYKEAQHLLGEIFYYHDSPSLNFEKAIYYYNLAANQNYIPSQCMLGFIFYKGQYVKRDIPKALYYLNKCAQQNHHVALYFLGNIYFEGIDVPHDILKGMEYYEISAEQNNLYSQYKLGLIYFEGKLVQLNIDKAIHYFTMAANQNDNSSQLYLANIYLVDYYGKQDIDKAMYYLTLSANLNNRSSQFYLGYWYYEGILIQKNICRSIYFLELASKNLCRGANFCLGVIYSELNQMQKAKTHYIEDSNFDNEFAMNNLALIYKNYSGECNNIQRAITHFLDAIRKKSNQIAFYNLIHLFMFEDSQFDKNYMEIIRLLNTYFKRIDFEPLQYILCSVFVKKFHIVNIRNIGKEIQPNIAIELLNIIKEMRLEVNYNYAYLNEKLKNVEIAYNFESRPVKKENVFNIKGKKEKSTLKQINEEFYKGLGITI